MIPAPPIQLCCSPFTYFQDRIKGAAPSVSPWQVLERVQSYQLYPQVLALSGEQTPWGRGTNSSLRDSPQPWESYSPSLLKVIRALYFQKESSMEFFFFVIMVEDMVSDYVLAQ